MKRSIVQFGSVLLLLAGAALLIHCDEEGVFNPAGPPSRFMLITDLTATPNLVSAGGAQAVITGQIVDQDNKPYPGLLVGFEARLGTITPSDTTDNDGQFTADYQSGEESGIDTITVSTADLGATVMIRIIGVSAELSLQIEPPSILANGVDFATATATVIGRQDTISRVPVRFETSAGNFNGQQVTFVNTNADGNAFIHLTAPSSTTTITGTVTASIEENASSVSGSADLNRWKRNLKAPSRTAEVNAEASDTIMFRGVSIEVFANPTLIPGDGQATAEISARIKEVNHQAIPQAEINFSALYGTIPASANTDNAGVARVLLTSAALPGQSDLIIARFGPEIADSIEINYAPAVGRISLSADPESFIADGIRGTQIIIEVYGGTGLIAPGVEVILRSDAGQLSTPSVFTDNNGQAVVSLIGPSSIDDQEIYICGEVVDLEIASQDQSGRALRRATDINRKVQFKNIPEREPRRTSPVLGVASLIDSVSVVARGVQLRLTADPDSIVARREAESTITAEVFESTSGNPVPGDTVRFATTIGSIPASALLTENGRTQVTLTAGDAVGRAIVIGRYGMSHRDTTNVDFLPTIGSLSASANKNALLAGGIDSASVTVVVRDALGGSAPGIPIDYTLDTMPDQNIRTYTNADGQAVFNVVSPAVEIDTALRISVSAGELSEQLRIAVKAITRYISADPDSLSTGAETPVTVTFRAFERTTRRPVVGDTVWFSAVGGVIQPYGILNNNGVGSTSFLVGDEPGAAYVIGQLGTLYPDSVHLELVEPVASITVISARRSILGDGLDTTWVVARVANALDQPTQGVWVQFNALEGFVVPEIIRTDANGLAAVTFHTTGSVEDRNAIVSAVTLNSALELPPGEQGQPETKISGPVRKTRDLIQPDPGGSASLNIVPRIAPNVLVNDDPNLPLNAERIEQAKFTGLDQVEDSLMIELRGVTLNLRTEPSVIRANGRSRAGVNIHLTETSSGRAIANATIHIGATLGAIQASGTTGNDGTLVDSLTAGIDAGISIIRGGYGELITGVDSVLFAPDPVRLNLIAQVDPNESPADGESEITLRARVIENNGEPAEDIHVLFTAEDPLTALVDADEYLSVTRWENAFRVDDPDDVDLLRLNLQISGVDNLQTRISINRHELEQVALPRDPLWGETVLMLPTDHLIAGANRIEIISAQELGILDRFSVAGVRLGLVGSHPIGEAVTDADGWTEAVMSADRTAGNFTIKASLVEDPNRFAQTELILIPGGPAHIRISSIEDTLLATGIEETEILILVADEQGNPVGSEHLVEFTVEPEGRVEPAQVQTLGDGAASARFFAPASRENIRCLITAEVNDIQGRWQIMLNGARVSLTAEDDRILADGQSSTNLRARVSTADGGPVNNHRVDFRTTRGAVTPSAVTDESGIALAILTSADQPDSAIVSAMIGPDMTDSVSVEFSPLVEGIEIGSELQTIRGNGIDSTAITVTVTDGVGDGAENIEVNLDAENGRLSSDQVVTDENGQASLVFYSDAFASDEIARIIAEVEGHDYHDTTYVQLRGITVEVETDPDSLAANGVSIARVIARVIETETGNPVGEGRVRFLTDLGSISAAADLNENGMAEATFTAPLDVGTANLCARYGSVLESETMLVLVDRAAEMEFEVSPASILADGVKTADLIVRISDPWGGPAPLELINLNFDGPGEVVPGLGYTDANGELLAVATGLASNTNGRLIVTVVASGGRFPRTESVDLRGVSLDVNCTLPLIPGDGRSTSRIVTRVRETVSGHAVIGDTIFFATTAGVITRAAALDENGEAVAQLRSSEEPTIATVTVIFGDQLVDSTNVAFASLFSYLDLEIDEESLLANGVEITQVSASLRDTLGSEVPDVTIFFEEIDDIGTLSADSAVTDLSGVARVSFTSAALTEDRSIRIRAVAGALADTSSVLLRGVSLSMESEPDSIPANGIANATVSTHVRETTSGNPVEGRTVSFSVNSGVIPAAAVTDDQGIAEVRLIAPRNPGQGLVTARFGRTLTSEITVVYVRTIGSLELSAENEIILGDGISEVALTAEVFDQIGNTVPNIRVTFTASEGGLVNPVSVRTDGDGRATTNFRSFATRIDSVVTIEAVAEGGAADETDIRILGITTEMTASPVWLPANGRATSTVRFVARETTAHNPLRGHTINFSADRGTIGSTSQLDDNGVASVTFTAPPSPGDAVITGILGDTLVSAMVIPCNVSEPQGVSFSINPREVSVAGVGRVESATLVAEVTDAEGFAVADGSEIILRIVPDIGVHFANGQDTLVAETEDGFLRTRVSAGEEVGTVNLQAERNGQVLASGGELSIVAGPPARIIVRADLGIIYHPGGGFSAFPVSAVVRDRFTNPVEDSTVVRFSVIPDEIAHVTAVGYTNNGVVYSEIDFPYDAGDYDRGVWVTYADEQAGEEVFVRAAAGGDNIIDSTRAILPGALIGGDPHRMDVVIEDGDLTADGSSSTIITVHLEDDEGHPVADGAMVTLRESLGSIESPRFTAGGSISSVYRVGRVTGIDTIRIESGEVRDSISIRLRPGAPASITLTIDEAELRANGVEATDVRAQIRDRFNNTIEAGAVVSFSTELGEITDSVQTNEQGIAVSRLTAGFETGLSLVNATIEEVRAQGSVNLTSGSADGIVLASLDRNSLGVRGSGSPETATFVFEIRDDRGVPVDELNQVTVDFQLDGPGRTVDPDQSSIDSVAFLDPPSRETDVNGQVSVTLNSGYFAGALEVTAMIGDSISGQAIAVAVHGGPPDEAHFTVLSNRCVLTGIMGTPPDTTTITSNVGDRFSNPTTPGTIIHFSSTGGVIEGSARTDSLGVCHALLTTVRPYPIYGLDTVTAQTVDWQDQEVTTSAIVVVSGPTQVTFDTTNGWQIPYGSYREFMIAISDTFGNPLVAGSVIAISAEGLTPLGEEADGIILTGDAVEESIELQVCAQRVVFSVRLFNYVTGLYGAAVTLTVSVDSPNGDRERTLRGNAMGQVLSTENSRVVLLPNEIVADGTSESTVSVTVYDILGIAIPGIPPDEAVVSVTGGDPLVTQPASPSDDQGRLTASVVGRAVGQGEVQVRIDGQLLDDRPFLTLVPGPPARLNIQFGSRQLEVGTGSDTAFVFVSDQNGNPTADGTLVEFIANDGSFNPVAANTAAGRASSVFTAGTIAGPASFTVRASYRGGSAEADFTNLEFTPGPPDLISVTAEYYSIQVGTQVPVTITAEDQYGNSVAQDIDFNLSISPEGPGRGSIAPNSVRLDEEGQAIAQYTAGIDIDLSARVIAEAGDASGQSSLFTFVAGPPGRITLTANPDDLEVGNDVDLSVEVRDAYGNEVPDTTRVQFSIEPEDVGTVTPSVVNTQNGRATSMIAGVTQAGAVAAIAQSGEVVGSARINYNVGPLTTINVTAEPNQVVVNRSSTITATATDRFGNPVPNVRLNFTLTTNPGGTCRLQHNQRNTGENGTASTIFTAGGTVGSSIITVNWDDDDRIEGSAFVDIQPEGGG